MSTAWYRPNSIPRRIRLWTSMTGAQANDSSSFRRSIEVWDTTCVVTNMNARNKTGTTAGDNSSANGEDHDCQIPFSVLINPGNPSLSGVSKFSYFPVGGPEPPPSFTIGKDSHPIMGYVTSWGGMEVGNGMSFASNTVDGIVHQYGGEELKKECETALSNMWNGGVGKVGEGMAISTPTVGSELKKASGYDILVHTVPPFVDQDYRNDQASSADGAEVDDADAIEEHNNYLLAECYHNSLRTAAIKSPSSPHLKIASPLLGAGCRGFPTERAIEVAASATTRWLTAATTPDALAPEKAKIAENRNASKSDDNGNSNPFSLLERLFRGTREQSSERGVGEESNTDSRQCITLAFGIPDLEIREQLIKAIDREMEKHLS